MPCILPALYILQCYVSYILQLTIGNIFLVSYNRLQVSKAEVLNFWRQREKNLCLKPQSSLFIVCYLKGVKMFALFCLFLWGQRGRRSEKFVFCFRELSQRVAIHFHRTSSWKPTVLAFMTAWIQGDVCNICLSESNMFIWTFGVYCVLILICKELALWLQEKLFKNHKSTLSLIWIWANY